MAPSEAGGETGSHLLWVVGWLLLCVAMFVVAVWKKREVSVRYAVADLWFCAGCLLMAGAALWGGREANMRAGLNMAWYWVGVATTVCALRQAVTGPAARFALVLVLWGLTVSLAIHGIVQFAVTMPQTVRQYEQSTERERVEQLMAMGVDPTPGSATRIQFENRLKSTEPYATFALANSLAGVLAPSLVVAMGLMMLSPPSRWFVVVLVMSVVVVAVCIVLTKSRAALVAVAAGGAALMVADLRGARRFGWRLPAAGAAVAALAVVSGILAGAVDKEVVTEAFMSLSYRMEYWKATVEMIAEHWLIGVGSGNFQDYYGQYQAVHSSELVSDPHNFVLEIAATGGVMTAIVFVVGWAQLLAASLRHPNSSSTNDATNERKLPSHAIVWWAAGAGVFFGWGAALGMGFASDQWLGLPLPCLSGASGLAVSWWLWKRALHENNDLEATNKWLRVLAPVALGAALLNLMAAGGISHWAVMQIVVVLGTLCPNGERKCSFGPTNASYVLLGLVAILLVLQFTALRPVIGAQRAMSLAQQASSVDEANHQLQIAAKADPWSAEPWQMQAQTKASQGDFGPATWELFEQALRRDQRNASLWSSIGQWKLVGSDFGNDVVLWKESVEHYRRALQFRPRGPAQARLAWALNFGDPPAQREARQLAQASLDWNDDHPHLEQRLDHILLPSPNGVVSAEQAMRNLRKPGNP